MSTKWTMGMLLGWDPVPPLPEGGREASRTLRRLRKWVAAIQREARKPDCSVPGEAWSRLSPEDRGAVVGGNPGWCSDDGFCLSPVCCGSSRFSGQPPRSCHRRAGLGMGGLRHPPYNFAEDWRRRLRCRAKAAPLAIDGGTGRGCAS